MDPNKTHVKLWYDIRNYFRKMVIQFQHKEYFATNFATVIILKKEGREGER